MPRTRRWSLAGGALLCAALATSCGQQPPSAQPDATPAQAPPPADLQVELTAQVEASWGQRDGLALQGREAIMAAAQAQGLTRVEQIDLDVSCKRKRCVGTATATARP